MAHVDPLTELPPPSRFDPDDLQLPEDESQVIHPAPEPFMAWSKNVATTEQPLRPQILLVCFSKASCTLFHHVQGKQLIASLLLPEVSMAKNTVSPGVDDLTCCIYSLERNMSILVALVQYPVPPDRSHAWVRALFTSVNPESTLVVELLQPANFRSKLPADEPTQFVLESDKVRKEGESKKHGIPYLPSGSLVDGPAAAVLTYCQTRNLRCQMLVSWPEQEVRMLASSLQKLINILPGDPHALRLEQPSKAKVGKREISSYELFM